MCRLAKCGNCGKATYAGCGAHIEQVLGGIPAEDRCKCAETGAKKAKVGKAPGRWRRFLGL